MKKAEAISILATSVRPREAKDRAIYDEAVKMAIEALKCSETPKSSERTSETAQPDHVADISKKAEKEDCISRQAAIEVVGDWIYNPEDLRYHKDVINSIPAVQPTCKPMYADVSDTISRQWLMECVSEGWIKFDTEKDENKFMHLVRDIAPSAQPATSCSEIPNGSDDTISRQAAIDALARMMPRSYTPDGSHPADEEIFRAQEVFADCIEALEILPSAAPSTAHTTETTAETTAPSTVDWIPVERELPEDLAEVNVTWVNHEPEPYYEPIKSKPFTASAVYYEGNWYWYSSVCADVLAEYGRNDVDKVDDTIEITAWKPLPEPYRGGDAE